MAEYIAWRDRPTFVYYFGDFDENGLRIPATAERKLRVHLASLDVQHPLTFRRVAVTEKQIKDLNLPLRPSKPSKNWVGGAVDIDAIGPADLRRLVRDCIEQHTDPEALRRLRLVEESERESVRLVAENWKQVLGMVEGAR